MIVKSHWLFFIGYFGNKPKTSHEKGKFSRTLVKIAVKIALYENTLHKHILYCNNKGDTVSAVQVRAIKGPCGSFQLIRVKLGLTEIMDCGPGVSPRW